MKRMVSFFLATVLLITCTVSLAGNVSAKGLSQHVQVTSYDPNWKTAVPMRCKWALFMSSSGI